MRAKTLASLLILCGSTAAIAQVATMPSDPMIANNSMAESWGNDAMMPSDPMTSMNGTMPTDPMPSQTPPPPPQR